MPTSKVVLDAVTPELMLSLVEVTRALALIGLGGALAGAGGGLCQVSIMSPCTYLVTGAVTGNKDESTMQRIRRTYAAKGIKVLMPHASCEQMTCTCKNFHMDQAILSMPA